MNLYLKATAVSPGASVSIPGSKSETNRLLVLGAFYPELLLENVSTADDTAVLQAALEKLALSPLGPDPIPIDIHHAGTAMRFLTAYCAANQGKTVILSGSSRMQQRPIKVLVDALRALGATVTYMGSEGFPPLKITGQKLTRSQVALSAAVSSQYISALLLIAPRLENGLTLYLEGPITSRPYIEMTLGMLQQLGIATHFSGAGVQVAPTPVLSQQRYTIEPDWSSASYYYAVVALSEIGTQLDLPHFRRNSLQGDSALVGLYEGFGVATDYLPEGIRLRKTAHPHQTSFTFELNNTPDLAQTLAVTCLGLGVCCTLKGLHTLKIKETDRLQALQNELGKFGARVLTTSDSLQIEPLTQLKPGVSICTYDDHRMAMAFAPLALKVPLSIQAAEVVSKSYPTFWDDLQKIGFLIQE